MSFSKKFNSFNEGHSSHSSSDDEITPKGYEKIQALWKDLRQTKNMADKPKGLKTTEVNGLKGAGEYMYQNKELREKLAQTEKQLNMAQSEITLLKKKLKDAEAEIERCHTKIAKQLNVNAVQSNQLDDVTAKYENLAVMHKDYTEKSKETNQALLRQLTEREKEIEKLKFLGKEKQEKLSALSQTFEQVNNKANKLENTVEEKSDEITTLKHRVEESEKLMEELEEAKEVQNAAVEEVERLRAEAQRLIKLLKSTKEFKDFAGFIGENDGASRFLKDAVKHKRTASSDYSRTISNSGAIKTQKLAINAGYGEEKELWVPQDAYKITQEFIKRNRGNLHEGNMEKLLFELNRIWNKREEQKTERITAQYSHEVSKLKRKLSNNTSFEDGQNKSLVPRLSSDFKDLQKENHKPLISNASQRIPPSVRIISGPNKSGRMSEKIEDDQQSRPNTTCRRRGDSFEGNSEAASELMRLKTKLEEVIEEFIKKRREILNMYNGNPEIGLVVRKEDWLIESIETLLGEFCKSQKVYNPLKGKRMEKNKSNNLLNYTIL